MQNILDALTNAGIPLEALAKELVAQGVLVDVQVAAPKVGYVTKSGKTIQVTPKQKAHFESVRNNATDRAPSAFYTEVIVGQREERNARKARNKAIAAALDATTPGWRGLDAVKRATVWEAAQAAHQA